jgi:2-hydroxychromene-2-carboxylate isomerase
VHRPRLDFWFEFASTYSYPAAMRIAPLAREASVEVRFRPFLLGPIFKAQGWDTSPFNLYPAKGRYMWRDLDRICAELNLPFRRPDPFPQMSMSAARVALVGLADNWGEEFCRAVYRAEFGEGRRIDDPLVLAGLLAGLGVDPAPVLSAAQSPDIKSRLRQQSEEAQRLGRSARRASSPQTAKFSGAMTGWKRRSPGRSAHIPRHRHSSARRCAGR